MKKWVCTVYQNSLWFVFLKTGEGPTTKYFVRTTQGEFPTTAVQMAMKRSRATQVYK